LLRHFDGERAHREQLVDVLLRNLAGPIDLVRVHLVAQITSELRQKTFARGFVFRALDWVGKNPVEIEAADEKIAGETAAFIQRIARAFRQLQGSGLPGRHLRRINDWRGRCRFRRRFFCDLFFGCFER